MQECPRSTDSPPIVRANGKIAEADSDSVQILLAEDTPDDGRFLAGVLNEAGYAVTLECNGQQVLDRISADRIQGVDVGLVILDLSVNRFDVIVTAQRLRALKSAVPILALSVPRDEAFERECLEAGCSAYLEKPVIREQLLATVARLVCGSESSAAADGGAGRSADVSPPPRNESAGRSVR